MPTTYTGTGSSLRAVGLGKETGARPLRQSQEAGGPKNSDVPFPRRAAARAQSCFNDFNLLRTSRR